VRLWGWIRPARRPCRELHRVDFIAGLLGAEPGNPRVLTPEPGRSPRWATHSRQRRPANLSSKNFHLAGEVSRATLLPIGDLGSLRRFPTPAWSSPGQLSSAVEQRFCNLLHNREHPPIFSQAPGAQESSMFTEVP